MGDHKKHLRHLLLFLAASSSFCAPSSHAKDEGYMTGNQLLELCQSTVSTDFCKGYIVGVVDGYALGVVSPLKVPFAIPLNVTGKQLVDVIVKYLGNHPESRNQQAYLLVLEALEDAYLCLANCYAGL